MNTSIIIVLLLSLLTLSHALQSCTNTCNSNQNDKNTHHQTTAICASAEHYYKRETIETLFPSGSSSSTSKCTISPPSSPSSSSSALGELDWNNVHLVEREATDGRPSFKAYFDGKDQRDVLFFSVPVVWSDEEINNRRGLIVRETVIQFSPSYSSGDDIGSICDFPFGDGGKEMRKDQF